VTLNDGSSRIKKKSFYLKEQFSKILERREYVETYLTALGHEDGLIDGTDELYTNLHGPVTDIVHKLLRAKGYDPDNFNVYLLDRDIPNAFILNYSNDIFVNLSIGAFCG
jgi:hypothetical protein